MNTNCSVFTFINNTHLTDLSFISCKTHLNPRSFVQRGTEDDEGEDAEDAEELVDNEFETDSEAEDDE